MNEISSLISAKETISPLTVELSGSVNTVHLVLANVPIKQNYNWGTSFINGFSVLVPGLSRITHGVAEPSGETITKCILVKICQIGDGDSALHVLQMFIFHSEFLEL